MIKPAETPPREGKLEPVPDSLVGAAERLDYAERAAMRAAGIEPEPRRPTPQIPVRVGTSDREAAASLILEDRRRDWERPRLSRYRSEDQRRKYPSDLGFEFVSSGTEKEVVWPAKSFRG